MRPKGFAYSKNCPYNNLLTLLMAKGSFALITVVSRVEYLTSGTVSMASRGFQYGRPRVVFLWIV